MQLKINIEDLRTITSNIHQKILYEMILKTNVLNQIMKTFKIEPEQPQILQNAV